MGFADTRNVKPTEDSPGAGEGAAQKTADTPGHEPALLFCPACSTKLEGHRCKLVCRVCGYFMSCADYY